GDTYARIGLQPWFAHRTPLLNYYSWHFGRQNVAYVSRLESWFQYQNRHPDYRPPIYYRQQLELARRGDQRANVALLTSPLRDVARERNFVRLDAHQRMQWASVEGNMRSLARDRLTFERERRGPEPGPGARPGSRDNIARGQWTLPQ